jgi:integrase
MYHRHAAGRQGRVAGCLTARKAAAKYDLNLRALRRAIDAGLVRGERVALGKRVIRTVDEAELVASTRSQRASSSRAIPSESGTLRRPNFDFGVLVLSLARLIDDKPHARGRVRPDDALLEGRREQRLHDDVEGLVFHSAVGTVIDSSKLMSRVLKPAGRRAGVPWVGFHTFRHTCATTLFRRGLNAKQVQVWLGHHSPAFTLATYVHFLDDDLPDASFLDDVTGGGNTTVISPTESASRPVGKDEAESSPLAGESLGAVRAA